MNIRLYKSFIFLGILILLVGVACNLSSTDPTAESPADPVAQPPELAESASSTSGAVSTLQEVKGAVIQIEAEGTFADFEGTYLGAGRGSGFIIDSSGLAVTNNHVVTGAALLKVWIGGDTSKTYNARLVAVSECSDLAIIDIDGDGFPYLEWYMDPVTVGLDVYSAGFPLGDPEFTLTKGIVSKESADGESDWASVDAVIMHDATINPGNSGGPLVSANGKIVGVNYASLASANQYFAIGRDAAVSVINQLKTGTDVDSIGVNGYALTSDDGTISGIFVSSVKSGSPADRVGIVGGDFITSVESHPVGENATMAAYCDIIRTHSATDQMTVEVYRDTTGEILAGQLNGDKLAVTYAGVGANDSDTGVSTGDVTDGTATDGEAPTYYVEDFDPNGVTASNWSWFTTSGDENQFDLYTDNGKLIFDINGYDLYTYYLYDPYFYTDVRVDARAENRGKNTNNVSLLCRATNEGWYEFSIANNGLWTIWAYDGAYTSIASGGSTALNMGKGVNEYTIMCFGDTLALYINGVETHTMTEKNFAFRDGQVGIGVSSFDVLPIKVEFDWIAINENMN